MHSIQKYMEYWPVIGGTLLFFGLGLWLYLRSEAAMERSPKPLSWVSAYRKPGFPFRAEVLPFNRRSWLIPAALALVSALISLFYRLNGGMILFNRWISLTGTTYNVFLALISALGAAAMYYLLLILFDLPAGAVLGSLLFSLSPVHGHVSVSCLTVCLLLLVLYLRWDGVGFPGELLYLGAGAFFALSFTISPALLWLWPCLVILHWYKLAWYLGQNRISTTQLALSCCAALVFWPVVSLLAGMLRQYMLSGFGLYQLRQQLAPVRAGTSWRLLWQSAKDAICLPIRPSLLLEPMMDAPLLGLGFWGLFSAGGMAFKRRRVQGILILGLTAILLLLQILTGWYGLAIPLTLALGSLMKNASLGGKLRPVLAACILGCLFCLLLEVLGWILPLTAGLIERML